MNTPTPGEKRMIRIHDTLADKIEVLDDGTTISDIIFALGWVRKERARSRAKASKNKKVYVPTGNKPGRPIGWKKGIDFAKEESKN
jgi:hypothetical protein